MYNEEKKRNLSPESVGIQEFEGASDAADVSLPELDMELIQSWDLGQLTSAFLALRSTASELVKRIDRLKSRNTKLNSELGTLKIVLADKVIASFRSSVVGRRSGASFADVVKNGPASGCSTLVARLHPSVSGKPIDQQIMDSLLGAPAADAPVPQSIRQGKDGVFVTFEDDSQRDRAKAIIESNASGSALFESVQVKPLYLPLVLRRIPLGEPEEIRAELARRNPSVAAHLHSVRFVFKEERAGTGHLRILLSSRLAYDQCLSRGKLFLFNRSYWVSESDWNREVRRCFKCSRYGHITVHCRASRETCGKCSGVHRAAACTADRGAFKCPNCWENHEAGSSSCRFQISAVIRYKSRLGL